MRRWTLAVAAILLVLGLVALSPAAPASAHEEREAQAPDGSGSVPTYRSTGPALLVCKTDLVDFTKRIAGFPAELAATNQALWNECQTNGYRDLQEAVN